MLGVFPDAFRVPTNVLKELRRPPLFLVEPLQNVSDLVMCTVPGEEVLNEDKNWEL